MLLDTELVVEKRIDRGCVWINSRVKERKLQRPKRGHERRDVYIDRREYPKQSLQCTNEMCYIFLMPDEKGLCCFFRMGFHVKCCLNVYLMNISMFNECML